MAESVLETSTQADVAAYVDHDRVSKYVLMLETFYPRVVSVFGEPMGNNPWPHRGSVWCANELAKAFPDYDLYAFIPDDSLMVVPGWDEYLLGVAEAFPNGVGMIDIPYGGEICDGGSWKVNAPAVSGKWIDSTGWYAPPRFNHWCWPECMGVIGHATHMIRPPASRINVEHFNDMQEAQFSQAAEAPGVYDFICEDFPATVSALREAMACQTS